MITIIIIMIIIIIVIIIIIIIIIIIGFKYIQGYCNTLDILDVFR